MATVMELVTGNPTRQLFEQVYTPPWRSRLRHVLRRRERRLAELRSLTAGQAVQSCHCAGRQVVPLAKIRGSESRLHDFDAAFRPCMRNLAERWCRVAEAWQQGVALPPVELIQVGEVYVVRDGHHRISVARTYGAQEIEALVTVWKVEAPPPASQPGGAHEGGAGTPPSLAALPA